MAAPNYPALVRASSATAQAGVTHTGVNGTDQIQIPLIVASGAPAGKANVGDILFVHTSQFGPAVLIDANTGLAIDALPPLDARFYVATSLLKWLRVGVGFLAVRTNIPPGVGAGPVAFGANNVPAVIATPGAPAGWQPIGLSDGTFGFMPYWK